MERSEKVEEKVVKALAIIQKFVAEKSTGEIVIRFNGGVPQELTHSIRVNLNR